MPTPHTIQDSRDPYRSGAKPSPSTPYTAIRIVDVVQHHHFMTWFPAKEWEFKDKSDDEYAQELERLHKLYADDALRIILKLVSLCCATTTAACLNLKHRTCSADSTLKLGKWVHSGTTSSTRQLLSRPQSFCASTQTRPAFSAQLWHLTAVVAGVPSKATHPAGQS